MAVMSTSAVSVALPTIGRDLHASSTSLEWIVDAYVIVYASLLIAGGVLSDRQGRKGMFMIGVTLFGLGSLASGVAPTVGWLIGGGRLTAAQADAFVEGLHHAVLVSGGCLLVAGLLASALIPSGLLGRA